MAAIGAVAGTKAVTGVIDDIYKGAKGTIQTKLKVWKSGRAIQKLYQKIAHVRHVKTIWQVDKEVDLTKFYYPSRIAENPKPQVITTIDDFSHRRNIIIQGTLGQGKSIFLRFLTGQELQRGKRLPIFLELRRLERGGGDGFYITSVWNLSNTRGRRSLQLFS